MIIHKFDFQVLYCGNLVLSDNLNILSNTLLISLSIIVLNEEDIDHIFAPRIPIIYFKTQSLISWSFFKVQERVSAIFSTELHGLFKKGHHFYPRLSGR